jgi:soluble lytic murein transglycosylase-like protein
LNAQQIGSPSADRRGALAPLLVLSLFAGGSSGQEASPGSVRHDLDPQLRTVLLKAVVNTDSFNDRFSAEVWLTDMSQRLAGRVPDLDERLHIPRTVHHEATRSEIAPELVLAVIKVESNFDRYTISSSSALGLMQVMPFWVEELGGDSQSDLFDVQYNVLLGCRILKYYLNMENGELVRALGHYNGSLGRRDYSDRAVSALRSRWSRG